MANDNQGLLIAALVAIVAVVGLVILFSGKSATGAVQLCPANHHIQFVSEGGQYGKVCVPNVAVATQDDFGPVAGNAGRPSDATGETQRSFTNWCYTFPDVCCKAYPNECSLYLGGR